MLRSYSRSFSACSTARFCSSTVLGDPSAMASSSVIGASPARVRTLAQRMAITPKSAPPAKTRIAVPTP